MLPLTALPQPTHPPTASNQTEFETVRGEMGKEAKRAAKLEQRVGVVTGGLAARQDKLRAEAEEAWGALRTAQTELQCFRWGLSRGVGPCVGARVCAAQRWLAVAALGACLMASHPMCLTSIPSPDPSLHPPAHLHPLTLTTRALHEAEQRSAPDRIEALQVLVSTQSAREHDLQERYKALCHEREDLRAALQAVPNAA